ncbi:MULTISPECIES: hypothetical protein [unclassified Curtobacterium]|uniref:hypothetical protein n=1 Tax=unclassified Curtobacterium TaxID=257496 RepID=UPI001FB60400|nr:MULTISPECIES: hypothetical protein [unclassified Curtobacterium]
MTGEKYRAWAQVEAHGVSDLYFDWATGVAADEDIVKLVQELSAAKRQPNTSSPRLGWPVFLSCPTARRGVSSSPGGMRSA